MYISTHYLPFIPELPLVRLPSIGRTYQCFAALWFYNPKNFLPSSPKNFGFFPRDAVLARTFPLLAFDYSTKSAPKQPPGRDFVWKDDVEGGACHGPAPPGFVHWTKRRGENALSAFSPGLLRRRRKSGRGGGAARAYSWTAFLAFHYTARGTVLLNRRSPSTPAPGQRSAQLRHRILGDLLAMFLAKCIQHRAWP